MSALWDFAQLTRPENLEAASVPADHVASIQSYMDRLRVRADQCQRNIATLPTIDSFHDIWEVAFDTMKVPAHGELFLDECLEHENQLHQLLTIVEPFDLEAEQLLDDFDEAPRAASVGRDSDPEAAELASLRKGVRASRKAVAALRAEVKELVAAMSLASSRARRIYARRDFDRYMVKIGLS